MRRPPGIRGFTLVELLVSLVLVVMLTLILVTIVNSTAKTWRYTSGRIEEFRGATNAFEVITRRLGQATLNASWDYQYPNNDSTQAPNGYVRNSSLRFRSDKTETEVGSTTPHRPTYGTFFQAPLGYVDDPTDFSGMDNLINTCGYYVEFNRDVPPAFITQLPRPPPTKYRYRLMELLQPSNSLTIYSKTSGLAVNDTYTGTDWFTVPLQAVSPPVHVLAENVIALVVLPKLTPQEDPTGTTLAPNYSYDSSPTGPPPSGNALNPINQLPPLVQVTLVAIDETSANRVAQGAIVPSFDGLLNTLFSNAPSSGSASSYAADLVTLQAALAASRVNYRVFSSNVSIRGAKWSDN